jgi:hypothetical protein
MTRDRFRVAVRSIVERGGVLDAARAAIVLASALALILARQPFPTL